MIVLGLNCFHGDSSAALIRDGELVAAAEEERFRRVKHWAGFPSQAITYCLSEAGITLSDVDHVAINQDSRAHLVGKLRYILAQRPEPRLVWSGWKNRRARVMLRACWAELARRRIRWTGSRGGAPRGASVLGFSRLAVRRAVVVSVDGFGDFCQRGLGRRARARDIGVEGHVYFPHSLGIFYQALTQYLGFPHYGDEYKVMGLAPYGKPPSWRRCARSCACGRMARSSSICAYFRHHRERIAYQWDDGSPEFGDLFSPALEELLGPRRAPDDPLEERHRDIARSVQAMYEEAFFQSARTAASAHRPDRSRARGRMRDELRRQRQGPADDAVQAGLCAIGGGRCRRRDRRGLCGLAPSSAATRSFVMDHAYWGPQFNAGEIAALLAERKRRDRRRRLHSREIGGRGRALPADGAGDRRRQGRRLVSGADGMGAARARQSLDPLRSAPRRHEGYPQRQDQTAGILSPFRALCSRQKRSPNGSKRTTTFPS